MVLVLKNWPVNARDIRDVGLILGSRRFPQRRAGQPTPVFLPGKSPWAEESCGLQSMGSLRVRHNLGRLTC